ncbi:MAG: ATP-dependent Clp protease ATP-binding subunit [Lachnospiraceae bacterium]|nr:ATP-dependent Clp protease ATP-binding subunit [Candidatus Darwinimomas equi]
MGERFTSQAKQAINIALDSAKRLNHSYVGTEHLLLGLVREGSGVASKVLTAEGVTEEKIVDLIDQLISPNMSVAVDDAQVYTPMARKIIENSYREAVRFKAQLIGTEHLLFAMLREPNCVATKLLTTMGINLQKLYIDTIGTMGEDINRILGQSQQARPAGGPGMQNMSGMPAGAGRSELPGENGSSTPVLDQYSRDFTKLAQEEKLDPVVGREIEMQRVMQILSRRTKNNPCLIGEPGVGKTAVVEGLAQLIVKGDVPETLIGRRLVVLDLPGMVAGSKYRGEFEERIKRVMNEVMEAGNILLFIDEIHTIIGAGGAEGALDASNILKPALSRGELQIIGATTIDEYRKHIEKDAALERRFQPVVIEEPTEEETLAILKGVRGRYEQHHMANITDDALEAAVKLSSRYISDRFLPDKAIDLIDEAASRRRLMSYRKPDSIKKLEKQIEDLESKKEEAIRNEAYEKAGEIKRKQADKRARLEKQVEKWQESKNVRNLSVTEDDIAEAVSAWTKIPVKKLAQEESEKLRQLENVLHERVIGQHEAVTAVARAIRRGRVGLKDPKRPIGSFLFLGPTGVGKTELCKALAEAMFGTEQALIRVDMSEYMEKHSVSKMVGSPPGYVGYEEGGQLSEKVRRNPYCVILFDEIEKAHPDVFNILLQVLDDGHITDAQGRRVDFKNTIIIMTSNAGAERIVAPKQLGFASQSGETADYEQMKSAVTDEIKKMFKPEFLNRIDETIVFHQLTRDDMKDIIEILLRDINKHTAEQMNMEIRIDDEAKEYLIDVGFDQKYGARPLKRALQSQIEDRLAEEVLNGSIAENMAVRVHAMIDEDGRKKLVFVGTSKKEEPENTEDEPVLT